MFDLQQQIIDYLFIIGEIIVAFLLIELVFKVFLKLASKVTQKTKSDLDDKIIEEINRKAKYLSALLAVFLVLNYNYGNFLIGGMSLYDLFLIGLIVIAGSSAIRIVGLFLEFYFTVIAPKTGRKIEREAYHLVKNIVLYSLYVILAITVLGVIGIDITPMIAGLGVAGIAVGLALQDTLSNFFSGIYILLDRPIKLGDYVKIGNIEGIVTDIGWRSTKVITWNNILVIIPNRKVADEIIINYFKPTDPIVHVIEFGVEYGSDIEKVKEIALKVIEELKKEGLVLEDQPSWVAFREFGESSLNFKAGLCVTNYRKRFSVQEVFLSKLYKEFGKNGIGIPFPTRTVYLRSEKGSEKEEKYEEKEESEKSSKSSKSSKSKASKSKSKQSKRKKK